MNPEKDFSRLPPNFIIPGVSEREKILRKIDKRDKAAKAFEFLVLALVVGLTLFSLLRIGQLASNNETNIAEHRNQIERAIIESKKSGEILLCTTSIPVSIKTQAEIDKCYPNGSQAEYLDKLKKH